MQLTLYLSLVSVSYEYWFHFEVPMYIRKIQLSWNKKYTMARNIFIKTHSRFESEAKV